MAYPKENLESHEDIVLDLHPHWWFFTPSLASLVLTIVLGLMAFVGGWPDPVKMGIAVLILACLVWFGTRYAQWATTDLVLTTDRLIWRTGVIAKRGIEIPLERINTIFFSQKLWERLIGVGDLKIESASASGAQVFENMKRPGQIQNEINVQRKASTHRSEHVAPPPAPAAPAPSITDQIDQLAALRDRGAITDAEFEAKKAELLGRL